MLLYMQFLLGVGSHCRIFKQLSYVFFCVFMITPLLYISFSRYSLHSILLTGQFLLLCNTALPCIIQFSVHLDFW